MMVIVYSTGLDGKIHITAEELSDLLNKAYMEGENKAPLIFENRDGE